MSSFNVYFLTQSKSLIEVLSLKEKAGGGRSGSETEIKI